MGYFTPINRKPLFYIELYGGYGSGKNSIKEIYRESSYLKGGFYKNKYHLFFIQPAVAFHHKRFLQAGISLRTALVNHSNVRTDYNVETLQNSYVKLDNLDKNTLIFFQPAASVRFALSSAGNLYLNAEVNGALRISGPAIYNRKAVILLGLTYSPFIKKGGGKLH